MRALILFLLSSTTYAAGVELRVQYSAIQKVLAQQMFGEEGKLYVKGTPTNHCSFAYLENPMLAGADGNIEIRAHFSGKNATSFFGRCWGMGDTFDLRVIAVPYFVDGLIRLRNVNVETAGRDTFYARKVREHIIADLPKKFEYRVTDEAKRILERKPSNEPYQQQLQNFQVSQIKVTPEALVLWLEFTLIVK